MNGSEIGFQTFPSCESLATLNSPGSCTAINVDTTLEAGLVFKPESEPQPSSFPLLRLKLMVLVNAMVDKERYDGTDCGPG